ncbi:NACHT domain-containing protein [Shewanella baltica]|uniref:NACHT domain-containing protein n=1 Tax=Shewanella baltica TaxID=62322 RepID=UPI003218761D
MSGIESNIALEAIKPTASLIQALLSPKIEKVKSWADEQELKGQLDPDKLSKTMDEYLKKLALRVSEITSIAFPLLKLNIFEAYEPLVLAKIHHSNLFDENIVELPSLIVGDVKPCLIIDSAGMGKSTFSKFIVASLLFKSQRIPIFFELRKINKEQDLIENLAMELDFPGKKFDRTLFYRLLQLGKFYVIIDGFDEVPLDYQESLSNQINELSLKGGDNIILLTSRPQDNLPDIVKAETLRFKPFSESQAISLLKRYDEISGLNIGIDLTSQIGNVPNKFIESPLLVSLLYRTFGVNKSIAEKICTFYEEIYHALYKGHDLINKNGYGREKKSKLDFEDFRKLVRAMCYYMMLNRKTSFESWSDATKYIEKAATICSIAPSSASNFLDDLLISVPLMHREGSEIKFFHKTLLEYFSAEYILFDKSSRELLDKLFNSKLSMSFEKTFEFLFELNSSLFDSVITYHFAKLAKDISIKNDDSPFVITLKSLAFRKRCKIGIWQQSKHKIIIQGHERPLFRNHENTLIDEGFHTATWSEGVLNRKKYFIALTYTDVITNFHSCAWNSISEKLDTEDIYSPDINSKEMKILEEHLGTNKWVDLDYDLITKIKDVTGLYSMVARSINSVGYDDRADTRILSNERINYIIQKVKKEEEFADNIEQFI